MMVPPTKRRLFRLPIGLDHAVAVTLMTVGLVIPLASESRTWHVPGDAPTILAGIDSSRIGDDVLVSSGTYHEANIVMKAGIWLHSKEGPEATVINAGDSRRAFDCLNLQQTSVIEGFGIRNGHANDSDGSGGAVRCYRSRLEVRNCIISECSADVEGGGITAWQSDLALAGCKVVDCSSTYNGGGVNAYDTSVTISDCEVLRNHAGASDGGMFAHGPRVTIINSVVAGNVAEWGFTGGIACASPLLTIQNCIITRNVTYIYAGGGLSTLSSSGTITGCTVADNVGWPGPVWGIVVDGGSTIAIFRTIVAFHEGGGLGCASGSHVAARCLDLYGNDGGNEICGDDLGGNFSSDPLFCDSANGDYTLDWSSPCLPGNHPDSVDCGLIGARDAGCGSAPTGACCFADGTCLVLGQTACGEQGGNYMGNGTTCDPNECQPTPVQPTTWGRIKASYR